MRDFKDNCTLAGEEFFFQKFTFSNLEKLQFKRLLSYGFEILREAK